MFRRFILINAEMDRFPFDRNRYLAPAVVGASESILKLNSKTLKNVYEAISGDNKKVMVDKPNIWKMWDGGKEELEALATYNLDDSFALEKVYDTFIPPMIELARLTYDPLTDVCVSTTGQLVEFMMMHSSCHNGELIPNKPDDRESRDRLRNPMYSGVSVGLSANVQVSVQRSLPRPRE